LIVKERDFPIYIQKLQALLKRLPPSHPRYHHIKDAYTKAEAGYKGEKSVQYPLSFLSPEKYFILHDIRLQYQDFYFQIDTLVLSEKYALILEIKNIYGTIIFDQTFHQLIRVVNGKEEGFPSPLTQIKRSEKLLKHWFDEQNFPDIPILSLVVISNPNSVIKSIPKDPSLPNQVIRSDFLPLKIDELEQQYKGKILSLRELKRLAIVIKKYHTPLEVPILERYSIDIHELTKGVICPNCHDQIMYRKHGSWICLSCNYKDRIAHMLAIKEFALLIEQEVTINELMSLLKIPSRRVCKYLLKSMNIKQLGNTSGTTYSLNVDDVF